MNSAQAVQPSVCSPSTEYNTNGKMELSCTQVARGFVETAHLRVEAMRSAQGNPINEPTLTELYQASGKRVHRCKLRSQNWRNRVYRIEFEDCSLGIAKQLAMGSDAMLRYQYEQLRELAALRIAGLRVPKTLGLLPEKRVTLMEFAPGESIEALVWRGSDVLAACNLAGRILAGIELARSEKIEFMPVELLARDFAAAPWRLSPTENEILQRTLERLSHAEFRIGQVYYDYKPANLLYHNSQLSLVDPPDCFWHGAHLWDFSCFCSSMRRHIWQISLQRPLDRHRRPLIREGLVAFERGYRSSFSKRYPKPGFFALAVRLFELQRNAVLTTMQNAKLTLAHGRGPTPREKRVQHPLRSRMTSLFLEMEKRWLFRQLARELS